MTCHPLLHTLCLAVVLAAALLAGGCGGENNATDGLGIPPAASGSLDPETLVIALLPDEDPATILREHEPFRAWLSERLGRTIELKVHNDYNIMIEAMRAGHLHLAYFGPASYVLARDAGTHLEPFVAKLKGGSTTYTSTVIGSASNGVTSVADLAGRNVGYGDPASTSSHLIPKSILLKAGLTAGTDYTESFLGAHDAVALNVASGSVDGGGLSSSILAKLLEQGSIQADQIVVLAESEPFPQYPWTMRSDLAPELKAAIVAAFIDLTDAAVLKPLHAQGFAAIDDSAYDVVRDLQATVGQ